MRKLSEALVWSLFWVAIAVGFGVYIWMGWGSEFGQQYFAGYVIEKSLAVDNLLLWAIIFATFAVPREYQHRVLFYGVIGALVFRAIFIAAGAALLEQFAWILYVFAVFLSLQRHRHDPRAQHAPRPLQVAHHDAVPPPRADNGCLLRPALPGASRGRAACDPAAGGARARARVGAVNRHRLT